MKRILYVALALVVTFLGLSFAYKNAQVVQLQWYFGLRWEAALSLMLLSAFALGAVAGFLSSLRIIIGTQRSLAQARREIRQLEQEVANLRSLPIKDVL